MNRTPYEFLSRVWRHLMNSPVGANGVSSLTGASFYHDDNKAIDIVMYLMHEAMWLEGTERGGCWTPQYRKQRKAKALDAFRKAQDTVALCNLRWESARSVKFSWADADATAKPVVIQFS